MLCRDMFMRHRRRVSATISLPVNMPASTLQPAAVYGQDVRLPGMRFAVIARPPVIGGKVKYFDASETLKVPGVEKVLEIAAPPSPSVFLPMGGLAVVANNTWAAMKKDARL